MGSFEYSDGETVFEGYLSYDAASTARRPCVLVGHAWSGPGDHFNAVADDLARQGYIGLAFDMYGKGRRGDVSGDNSHLMNPLMGNRALLRQRVLAAFNVARSHALVNPDKIAVMGHCFGGLCALDLARANPPGLRGAISIHGLLIAPDFAEIPCIDASILVLHGWNDPMVSPEMILSFADEMTRARADWQIHAYGNAMHAFTFEGANIPELGIKYDKNAHMRSISAISGFLREVLR
ncbi:MAG: alpha/beta fold hydrolase [Calothrix sp. SM1_5_4]|nr:alpha/beta fold hydrolase [Calothrix sp. SM1_5_4]